MLNDIAISKTMQDYETLNELIEEYCKKTYLVDDLFG
jgi:phosphorylcholine metabolism protein LicD